MSFVESLTYEQLSQIAGCSAAALRKRVSRYGISKAEALSHCTGLESTKISTVTTLTQLENLFNTKIDMTRRFTRSAFDRGVTNNTNQQNVEENNDDTVIDTLIDTKQAVFEQNYDENFFERPLSQNVSPKVEQDFVTQPSQHEAQPVKPSIDSVTLKALEERLREPATQVVTLIKSDILAVTAMLVLSVLIAFSFTAKIFIASGVVPIAAYVMSILLDFTMIVFVFRGHTQIAWLFGVNVFAQVALTTSARMFLSFMSEATLIGIKGLLVAFSIVIAIKGLSDFVQKNFK